MPGYHTVRLEAPAQVTPGKLFSVVVKLTTPGYYYPIPLEMPLRTYSSNAAAEPGQSFISSDGEIDDWIGITTLGGPFAGTNVCLKAFAGNYVPRDTRELKPVPRITLTGWSAVERSPITFPERSWSNSSGVSFENRRPRLL